MRTDKLLFIGSDGDNKVDQILSVVVCYIKNIMSSKSEVKP